MATGNLAPATTGGDEAQLTLAVGRALKRQRLNADMTLSGLAGRAGVSQAMISRIENGQVSPSLATLDALATALGTPVALFFADTVQSADISFVRAGGGIDAKRIAPNHVHDYRVLGHHQKEGLDFESARVTLSRADNGTHPEYVGRGFVFLTIVEGDCIYRCGAEEFEMTTGDSLSFDAQLSHGVVAVTSEVMTFVSTRAKTI